MAAGDLKELASEVAELRGANRGLETGIDDLKQTTNKLSDKMEKSVATSARIEAKLDAYFQRTRDESDALFAARNSHEQRISGIERDYTPQSLLTRETARVEKKLDDHATTVLAEQKAQDKAIGSLQRTEARAGGIAAVVSILISAASGFGKYLWH